MSKRLLQALFVHTFKNRTFPSTSPLPEAHSCDDECASRILQSFGQTLTFNLDNDKRRPLCELFCRAIEDLEESQNTKHSQEKKILS